MKQSAQIIFIICESHIPSDGRILRFARTMREAGYQVAGFGYDKNDRSPPAQADLPLEIFETRGPKASALRLKLIALSMAPARLLPAAAIWSYWLMPERRRLWSAIVQHMHSRQETPDFVIAKHWSALPVAIRLAEQTGATLIYDMVEISHAEYEENWKWRLIVRPVIAAIEARGFARAEKVLTIGEAAAAECQRHNNLDETPIVIRNVPDYFAAPDRPTSNEPIFLYHGLAFADRNLEELIESVKYWREGPRLVLRLTGKPSYLQDLKALASRHDVAHRIEFADPVVQSKVVQTAASADVGLCLFPTHSRQKQLAEPNKLFQYVMAGLAVLSSDLPNLSALVDRYGFGIARPAATVQEIARAVNDMTVDSINQMRARSRQAAKTLCWQSEQKKLLDILRRNN